MNLARFAVNFLLIAISSVLCTGCATIIHGTRQTVGISSNPSNANIWIDRTYVGKSPLFVEMTRKDNHIVILELEGFEPYEIAFTRQASAWVLGNIVFGGVIGLAVDAISGGLYRLTPEQVQAEMRSSNMMAYSKSSNESFITIVLEPKSDWEKVGNLVAVK